MSATDAVYIRNVNFSYGNNQILRNFCARIPYGQIYALLGPSGGGKTTLLKLILGRLKMQQGTISVLGMTPGEANSTISFMPQEVGLCDNLTINQTLKYFKLIYRISNEEFYARRKELTTLTNLPNGNMLVRELSGGTKRRLSIAVSLINSPNLVILDEPTVGIDALLRNQIWDYLVSKAAEGMTMIIVTHYIEEAVNAGRVGLMRNGALLAEDNPQRLMSIHGEANLEAVFLKLCCYEDKGLNLSTSDLQNQSYQNQKTTKINPYFCPHHYSIANHHHNPDEIFIIPNKFDKNFECSVSNCSSLSSTPSWRTLFNTSLLTIKLWILLTLIYRNLNKFACSYFSIIIVLLPATQALIFCLAVSKDITLIPAAVYNEEPNPGYGKLFIDAMKSVRGHLIQPKFYNSLEEATNTIQRREAIGAIWISENYTDAIDIRIEDGLSADNETIEDSTIRIFIDNSYYILSIEFYTTLLQSFGDFSRQLFHSKYMDLLEVPIKMEKTALSEDYRFKDYFMPGYFLLFLYISQITIASLTLNKERKDGLFERSLIAGVSHELVFFSHIITSLVISIVQLWFLDIIAFALFDNPSNSSYWLKFSLLLLESLNAMSLGFVISSSINSEISCLVLVWFITIPQCLSAGVLWPLESLSQPFNYLFYLWPLSIPVKTIRHIMLQGWDLSNIHVQYGFLSIGIPMILFFYIALIIFKRKQ
ncbi:ABC transporter G family member 20-like [Dermatophagoides pteronyssinus]|uniref:ABC transporter G family member 20-like n=1 Tax=Dermatophagoides pteronyssinus TaxID=6956 RepID=UPI003F6702D9